MLYVIKDNENIYDVALKLYGDASFAVKIITENPTINLLSDISNIEITYDELIKQQSKLVSASIISDTQIAYNVKTGQSIYDLSIGWGYGVENIVSFIQKINLGGIDSSIDNSTISVTKNKTNLSNYLDLQKTHLSTGVSLISGLLTDDGIQITTDSGEFIIVD